MVVRLVISSTCSNVPDLVSDLVALFEDSGRLVSYDKLTESAASMKVGSVDISVFGGSSGLVKIDLSLDSQRLPTSYASLVSTFRRLFTGGIVNESVMRYLEATCSHEAYIPLSGRFRYGVRRVSEVLGRYGVVVSECNAESINGMDLVSASGTYVARGLGIVRVLYIALIRNYAVRSALSMSKRLQPVGVTEDSIRRLATESYLLAQLINEELYLRSPG